MSGQWLRKVRVTVASDNPAKIVKDGGMLCGLRISTEDDENAYIGMLPTQFADTGEAAIDLPSPIPYGSLTEFALFSMGTAKWNVTVFEISDAENGTVLGRYAAETSAGKAIPFAVVKGKDLVVAACPETLKEPSVTPPAEQKFIPGLSNILSDEFEDAEEPGPIAAAEPAKTGLKKEEKDRFDVGDPEPEPMEMSFDGPHVRKRDLILLNDGGKERRGADGAKIGEAAGRNVAVGMNENMSFEGPHVRKRDMVLFGHKKKEKQHGTDGMTVPGIGGGKKMTPKGRGGAMGGMMDADIARSGPSRRPGKEGLGMKSPMDKGPPKPGKKGGMGMGAADKGPAKPGKKGDMGMDRGPPKPGKKGDLGMDKGPPKPNKKGGMGMGAVDKGPAKPGKKGGMGMDKGPPKPNKKGGMGMGAVDKGPAKPGKKDDLGMKNPMNREASEEPKNKDDKMDAAMAKADGPKDNKMDAAMAKADGPKDDKMDAAMAKAEGKKDDKMDAAMAKAEGKKDDGMDI